MRSLFRFCAPFSLTQSFAPISPFCAVFKLHRFKAPACERRKVISLNRFTLFGCAERVVGFLTRCEPSTGSRGGVSNGISKDLWKQEARPAYDQLIAKKTHSLCRLQTDVSRWMAQTRKTKQILRPFQAKPLCTSENPICR